MENTIELQTEVVVSKLELAIDADTADSGATAADIVSWKDCDTEESPESMPASQCKYVSNVPSANATAVPPKTTLTTQPKENVNENSTKHTTQNTNNNDSSNKDIEVKEEDKESKVGTQMAAVAAPATEANSESPFVTANFAQSISGTIADLSPLPLPPIGDRDNAGVGRKRMDMWFMLVWLGSSWCRLSIRL